MRKLLLLLALTVCSAQAGTYKCIVNGKTVYQDQICSNPDTNASMQATRRESLAGCYEYDFNGRRPGDPFETFALARNRNGNPNYLMLYSSNRAVEMKPATADELRIASQAFRMEFKDGYTVNNGLGVYRGKDGNNVPVIFAYLHTSNGRARKIPCAGYYSTLHFNPSDDARAPASSSCRRYRRGRCISYVFNDD